MNVRQEKGLLERIRSPTSEEMKEERLVGLTIVSSVQGELVTSVVLMGMALEVWLSSRAEVVMRVIKDAGGGRSRVVASLHGTCGNKSCCFGYLQALSVGGHGVVGWGDRGAPAGKTLGGLRVRGISTRVSRQVTRFSS